MVARRIIPCLDIDKGRVVKGVNFRNLKDAGCPVRNALFYDKEGADELVFLDITASFQKREIVINLVKKVANVIFMPFTVGGGIRTEEEIRELLKAGADKISLNTAAVENPRLIRRASLRFGRQCIVVAIDARKRSKGSWEVYTYGGRRPTGIDAVNWAKEVEFWGAGEILLTSMDYDGTRDGYDIELTEAVSSAVKIPVIASGGAGKPEDFYKVFKKTKATAALAASIFHYRLFQIKKIKEYLRKKGVEVRI